MFQTFTISEIYRLPFKMISPFANNLFYPKFLIPTLLAIFGSVNTPLFCTLCSREKETPKKIFCFFSVLNMVVMVCSAANFIKTNRSASMDNVKHSFTEKIKQSSHFLTDPGRSNLIIKNEEGVTPILKLLNKKKVGQSPNGKSSIIQKNRKIF